MPNGQKNPFWSDFARFVIISILVIVPIRAWVAQPFIVRGASMEPTFHDSEYLIIDEITYELRKPERGEVIVFRFPEDTTKFFIKRVIGLPGETIEIRDNKVFLITDGEEKELKESYLSEPLTAPGSITRLGEKEYLVLGDNRLFSSDSRRWGALQENLIIGRAWLRLWPPGRINFLPGLSRFQI